MSNKTKYDDLCIVAQKEGMDDYTVVYMVENLKYNAVENRVCYEVSYDGGTKYINAAEVSAGGKYMIAPKNMADIVIGGRIILKKINQTPEPINIDKSIVN